MSQDGKAQGLLADGPLQHTLLLYCEQARQRVSTCFVGGQWELSKTCLDLLSSGEQEEEDVSANYRAQRRLLNQQQSP